MIPSSEPQLEPQCINTVKVVPKQPLVPDKAQVFIQPESCCIADFSLKNNLEYKLIKRTTSYYAEFRGFELDVISYIIFIWM